MCQKICNILPLKKGGGEGCLENFHKIICFGSRRLPLERNANAPHWPKDAFQNQSLIFLSVLQESHIPIGLLNILHVLYCFALLTVFLIFHNHNQEDMDLFSISVLHQGSPKVWYTVAPQVRCTWLNWVVFFLAVGWKQNLLKYGLRHFLIRVIVMRRDGFRPTKTHRHRQWKRQTLSMVFHTIVFLLVQTYQEINNF